MNFVTEEISVKTTRVILHALILKEQVLLIVTDQSLQAFNNLLLTVQTKFDNLPSIINLSQDDLREDEEYIQVLAQSIGNYLFDQFNFIKCQTAKKLKMSVIFSFNLQIILDQNCVKDIQLACVEMIQKCLSTQLL